jgi:hypothetical protein
VIDLASLSVFVLYLAVTATLFVMYIRLVLRYKRNVAFLIQAVADNEELLKKFDQVINDQSNRSVEETDGFVKFISQSREWAFEYIEDVQNAIKVLSETPRSDRSKYNEAYKALLNFLPEETKES